MSQRGKGESLHLSFSSPRKKEKEIIWPPLFSRRKKGESSATYLLLRGKKKGVDADRLVDRGKRLAEPGLSKKKRKGGSAVPCRLSGKKAVLLYR